MHAHLHVYVPANSRISAARYSNTAARYTGAPPPTRAAYRPLRKKRDRRPTGNWRPARAERDCALAEPAFLPRPPADLPPDFPRVDRGWCEHIATLDACVWRCGDAHVLMVCACWICWVYVCVCIGVCLAVCLVYVQHSVELCRCLQMQRRSHLQLLLLQLTCLLCVERQREMCVNDEFYN